jgi:hypothetical protein
MIFSRLIAIKKKQKYHNSKSVINDAESQFQIILGKIIMFVKAIKINRQLNLIMILFLQSFLF